MTTETDKQLADDVPQLPPPPVAQVPPTLLEQLTRLTATSIGAANAAQAAVDVANVARVQYQQVLELVAAAAGWRLGPGDELVRPTGSPISTETAWLMLLTALELVLLLVVLINTVRHW
jgi:hypothetical protein